jgi:hypothetical protein
MGVIAHAIGRIVLAAFFFLTIATPPAYASTDSTEITDQWWNPAESGWGVRDQRALVRWPIPPANVIERQAGTATLRSQVAISTRRHSPVAPY